MPSKEPVNEGEHSQHYRASLAPLITEFAEARSGEKWLSKKELWREVDGNKRNIGATPNEMFEQFSEYTFLNPYYDE